MPSLGLRLSKRRTQHTPAAKAENSYSKAIIGCVIPPHRQHSPIFFIFLIPAVFVSRGSPCKERGTAARSAQCGPVVIWLGHVLFPFSSRAFLWWPVAERLLFAAPKSATPPPRKYFTIPFVFRSEQGRAYGPRQPLPVCFT